LHLLIWLKVFDCLVSIALFTVIPLSYLVRSYKELQKGCKDLYSFSFFLLLRIVRISGEDYCNWRLAR
jgi:hypothetical protein